MSRIKLFTIILGVCSLALLMMPSVASADNYTTTTPIPWCISVCGSGDLGTLSGSFQLDASGNPTTWDLVSTSLNGSTYTPSDEGTLSPIVTGGEEYTFSDQFATGLNLGGTPLFNGGTLSITVNCQGVTNCLLQGTAGQYFQITSAVEDFATWGCSVNGSSCNLSVAAPVTLDTSGGAFINVSGDPSYGIDGTAIGTAWTPGSGGGTPAPEPSSLLLLGCGLTGLFFVRRYRTA